MYLYKIGYSTYDGGENIELINSLYYTQEEFNNLIEKILPEIMYGLINERYEHYFERFKNEIENYEHCRRHYEEFINGEFIFSTYEILPLLCEKLKIYGFSKVKYDAKFIYWEIFGVIDKFCPDKYSEDKMDNYDKILYKVFKNTFEQFKKEKGVTNENSNTP